MKFKGLAVIGLMSVFLATAAAGVFAQGNYRISAPYTYKNLTIFLIHGKDSTNKKNIITLQEANP